MSDLQEKLEKMERYYWRGYEEGKERVSFFMTIMVALSALVFAMYPFFKDVFLDFANVHKYLLALNMAILLALVFLIGGIYILNKSSKKSVEELMEENNSKFERLENLQKKYSKMIMEEKQNYEEWPNKIIIDVIKLFLNNPDIFTTEAL